LDDHRTYNCDPVTNALIYEKLTTMYKNPSSHTQLQISVRYGFNETIPSALENRVLLLQSDIGEDWDEKKKMVLPLVYKILASGEHRIWLTVTGFEFHTTGNGDIEWRSFEDVEETVPRILASEVPAEVKKIDVSELTNVTHLAPTAVYTAEYEDEVYALKAHEESDQDVDFKAELEARIKLLSHESTHLVPMIAVVVGYSPFEDTSYVDGMLLRYCSKGAIKQLLKYSDPPVSSERKRRWAAQIAHGISNIHKAGLIHGDLRCENVVVDENDDAYVADLQNGTTWMRGWHAELDDHDDPRRDVYSLGVTIWELIHDGEDPSI
jgi:serine/threonine protein kinase